VEKKFLTAGPVGYGQGHKLASTSVVVREIEQSRPSEPGPRPEPSAPVLVHTLYGPSIGAVLTKAAEMCGVGCDVQVGPAALAVAAQPLNDHHPADARATTPKDDDDVRLLEGEGPSSNRIDVVLMGDGYTVRHPRVSLIATNVCGTCAARAPRPLASCCPPLLRSV
jgi:hypothetical protein